MYKKAKSRCNLWTIALVRFSAVRQCLNRKGVFVRFCGERLCPIKSDSFSMLPENGRMKMELVNKWLDRVDNFLALIGGCTLFLMMIWIFIDVILRYFFNRPIVGTMEITGEYFMVIIVYFGISFTQKENGHINVDFLYVKFPRNARKFSKLIGNLISISIFIMLGIYNFQKGINYFKNDIRSIGLLDYPLAPALIIISIGILLLSVRILFNSIKIIRNEIDV